MRKLWFYLLILSALLLAACSQATATPVKQGEPDSTDTPKKDPAAETATPPKNAASGPVMQCQVVSLSPTQGPTEASMFPPVGKDDWVLGNTKNPNMTIIEYSDFQ